MTKKPMKTREELIEIAGKIERNWFKEELDERSIAELMADFALRVIEENKNETCKWKRLTPKLGGNWEATCQEDVITFSNLIVIDYFNHCPFCGRKIERV